MSSDTTMAGLGTSKDSLVFPPLLAVVPPWMVFQEWRNSHSSGLWLFFFQASTIQMKRELKARITLWKELSMLKAPYMVLFLLNSCWCTWPLDPSTALPGYRLTSEASWLLSTASENSLFLDTAGPRLPHFLPTWNSGLVWGNLTGPVEQVCVGNLMSLIFPEF